MWDIYFDLANMHQTVDEEETGDFWLIGEQFSFDFVKDLEEAETQKKSDGATCKSCGEYYPYAEPRAAFRCWACRNF